MGHVLGLSCTCVILFSIGLIIYLNILHGTLLNPVFKMIEMNRFEDMFNEERESDFLL